MELTAAAQFAARSGEGVVSDGATAYVVGGGTSSGAYADVWKSTDGSTWTSVTPAAGFGARTGHTVLWTSAAALLVLAGVNRTAAGSGQLLHDAWRSGDGGATWGVATASAPWGARYGAFAAELSGQVWLMGGLSPPALRDVWSGSTNGTGWAAAAAGVWSARGYAACTSYAGAVWVVGGTDLTSSFADVWSSSDLASGDWTEHRGSVGHRVPSQAGARLLVFSQRLWLFFGLQTSSSPGLWSSTDGDTWTLVASTAEWTPRDRMGVVVVGSRVLVVAGVQYSPSPAGGGAQPAYTNDVWASTDNLLCQADGLVCNGHGVCQVSLPAAEGGATRWPPALLAAGAEAALRARNASLPATPSACELAAAAGLPPHALAACAAPCAADDSLTEAVWSDAPAALAFSLPQDPVLRAAWQTAALLHVGSVGKVTCLCDSGYIQDGKCNETVCGPHNCVHGHCTSPSPSPSPSPAAAPTLALAAAAAAPSASAAPRAQGAEPPRRPAPPPTPCPRSEAGDVRAVASRPLPSWSMRQARGDVCVAVDLWVRAARGDASAWAQLGAAETDRCVCEAGWEGSECRQAICLKGCLHGSCAVPHTCVCDQGWRGTLCTIRETVFEDIGQFVERNQTPLFVTAAAFGSLAVVVCSLVWNYTYRPPPSVPSLAALLGLQWLVRRCARRPAAAAPSSPQKRPSVRRANTPARS